MGGFSSLSVGSLKFIKILFEEGSTYKAAKRLNVSQSNISYELKKLRELFGDPLFIRGKDGLVPNSRAKIIYDKIPSLLCDLENLYNSTDDFDPGLYQGEVNIAIIEPLALGLLPSLFMRLSSKCPGVELRLNTWSIDSAQRLSHDQIDLAIHVQAIVGNPLIRFEEATVVERAVACRKHHPISKRQRYTLLDMADYPMLLQDVHHAVPTPNHLEKECIKRKIPHQVAARSNYLPGMVEMLKNTNALLYSNKISLMKYREEIEILEAPMELRKTLPRHCLMFPTSQANAPFNIWLRQQVKLELEQLTEHVIALD